MANELYAIYDANFDKQKLINLFGKCEKVDFINIKMHNIVKKLVLVNKMFREFKFEIYVIIRKVVFRRFFKCLYCLLC